MSAISYLFGPPRSVEVPMTLARDEGDVDVRVTVSFDGRDDVEGVSVEGSVVELRDAEWERAVEAAREDS